MTPTIRRLLGILLLSLASAPAFAFCIYNETKRDIWTNQTANEFGSGYAGTIKGGKKACCNWKNKDCNPKGGQDTPLLMYVRGDHIGNGGAWGCGKDLGENETLLKVPAGGAAYVKRNPDYKGKGNAKRTAKVDTPADPPGSVPAIPQVPAHQRMYPDRPYVVAVYKSDGKLYKVYPCPAYDKADDPGDYFSDLPGEVIGGALGN